MAIGESTDGRQSPFERLLDELDEDDSPRQDGAPVGAQNLWPRANDAAFGPIGFQGGAVESLYAEGESAPEVATPPKPPETAFRMPDFDEIRAELAAAKSLDELRRLRRRCARSAHPDLVGPLERPLAEKHMAEVNAAIDRAIKFRRFAP